MFSLKIYSYYSAFILLTLFSACKKESPAEPQTSNKIIPETTPLAPVNLQIVSMSRSEVKLHWMDSSTNETSFVIEQGTDSVNFTAIKTVESNIDTTTITGIFLTTKTYFFRIKSKNTTFTSAASNIVQRSLFPPPTNFLIVSFSSTAVSISWNDNSDNESGFIIEQSIDSLAYLQIDSTGSNITSKSISGIFDSTKTFSFRVLAKTSTDKSAYSNAEAKTLGSWVFVAGGTFLMGRDGQFSDERPIHNVILSNYYISKFEVTVKEYRIFTAATNRPFPSAPSWGWDDNAPIVNVSWNEANNYCMWLDSITGKTIRLPTEAEWEFAARGGNNSQHFAYSGSKVIEDVAWYYLNANSHTYQCGIKKSNELGIFDMSGNAWEWCLDWQGSYASSIQRNPRGPLNGSNKIFRGGSWFDYGLAESECRVETRYAYTPNGRVNDGGFRIVKEI